MKKSILLSFIFIYFLSCNNKSTRQKNIKYYPSESFLMETNNRYPVDLSVSNLNFREYVEQINLHRKVDSSPYFVINYKNNFYNIIPQPFNRAGLIKFNNILRVSNDSILKNQGYKLTELPVILKKFYENNGEDLQYPDNPRKAIVMVTLDNESSSKELKRVLLNLVTQFDELNKVHNDSLMLRLVFDNFRQVPPPPPPPKN